jgi:endonuclease YncB( thermonuclease family)
MLSIGTTRRDVRTGSIIGTAALALSLFVALSAHAATYTARVASVTDGDTFKALHDGREIIVRLRWIDAPERGQRFSDQATPALSDLIAEHTVTVHDYGADLHHRRLADVTLEDGRSVNRELVRLGWAWWFRKYTKDITLRTLEAEARAAGRGLWADPHPIPPWEWGARTKALASP